MGWTQRSWGTTLPPTLNKDVWVLERTVLGQKFIPNTDSVEECPTPTFPQVCFVRILLFTPAVVTVCILTLLWPAEEDFFELIEAAAAPRPAQRDCG